MLRQFAISLVLLPGISEPLDAAFPGSKKSQAKPEVSFQQVQPLFAKYCYGCHGDTKKKADLSLQAFQTEADAVKDRSAWERVLRAVESREMPPDNKPQPSETERDQIAFWIDQKVLQCDCTKPDPGRVTIRRLNRIEYNNTIRDLLGVDFQPADDFPTDDSGYGFDNIGDVLSVSPVLFEKYMTAAEKILDQAIVPYPDTNGPVAKIPAAKMTAEGPSQSTRNNGIKLTREATLKTAFHFTKAGSYLIRIRAWGDQAGNEPPKMRLTLAGEALKTFDVANRFYDLATYEHRIEVSAGEKEIAVAYLNNYVNQAEPDPERRDRNLAVEFIEVIGPTGAPEFPKSHQRIFRELFANGKRAAVPLSVRKTAEYGREIVSNFAQQAFRRPVSTSEVDRLMSIYQVAREDGENFEGGVKLAFQAILVSPHFLFRNELQPEPDNPGRIMPVDEFALASRLSYFLWSSMPDEELFRLAQRKALRKNINSQIKRMLRDPKAGAFVENFVGQWLQLRNLKLVQPDAAAFPGFDEALREAMVKETELLFTHVMKENRSILEIINASYTFLNERLAKHYGIETVRGEAFQKVKLKNSQRGGVLTQASVLTLTSNPTRTSPVKRGKWVLDNILGAPPPPPPPDVPDLEEGKNEKPEGTLRQRLEQHRADPNCAGCHARMDPIGFSLENFDGIGAWRTKDNEDAIDPSGTLVSGENFKGAAELREILAEKKKDDFARCLTEKMLTYALGRGLEFYDKCAVDEVCRALAKEDYEFSALIFGIVNSTPFQMRRGESAK